MQDRSKGERLKEFVRRVEEAEPAQSHDEAMELIAHILNEVEDDLTTIPYDPDKWASDGRMYPPQSDSRRSVAGRDDLVRYRSAGHNTFVRSNGAFEIQRVDGKVEVSKQGADGQGVCL